MSSATGDSPGNPGPVSPPSRPGWTSALLAGAFACVLAWGAGEWIEAAKSVPLVSEHVVSGKVQFDRRAQAIVAKSTLSYAVLGAALGIGLGLVGGLASRSARRRVLGSLIGLIGGAALGWGAARIAVPFFLRNEDTTVADDLILPLLTRGAIWGVLGATTGLSLGVGLGRSARRASRAVLGGFCGALAGVVLFELLGGLLFPFDRIGQPIPEGIGSRLFAKLVLALAATLGAVGLSRRGP